MDEKYQTATGTIVWSLHEWIVLLQYNLAISHSQFGVNMTENELQSELDFIERYQELSEDQITLLRLLADDTNVNSCGVYVSGTTELTIESEKAFAKIEIIQGKNKQWFFGVDHCFRTTAACGGGFAPAITQVLRGDAQNSREEALLVCVNILKRRAENDLKEHPDVLRHFLSKIEAFCFKEVFDVTYGLPLFAAVYE